MSSHRTTARTVILVAALVLSTGTTAASATPPEQPGPRRAAPAKAAPAPAQQAPGRAPLIFPVVGTATYTSDFGDARGSGSHEGTDIMAPWRSVAVAAEAGTVKFWTTSARAGCMLYLHGRSGTTYLYIHLNNDRTRANDNRGGCVPGVAYAFGLKSGGRVQAGQPIGYVGNSGDADGGSHHLHFEVHPRGKHAVDPYPYLRRARKLLFAVQPGKVFTAALRGKVVQAQEGVLRLAVDQVQSWPGGLRVAKVGRKVDLAVPPTTVVTNPLGAFLATARLSSLKAGQGAVAWTEKATATLAAQLGEPLALATERVVLSAPAG